MSETINENTIDYVNTSEYMTDMSTPNRTKEIVIKNKFTQN